MAAGSEAWQLSQIILPIHRLSSLSPQFLGVKHAFSIAWKGSLALYPLISLSARSPVATRHSSQETEPVCRNPCSNLTAPIPGHFLCLNG